jgi:hypothetical protein
METLLVPHYRWTDPELNAEVAEKDAEVVEVVPEGETTERTEIAENASGDSPQRRQRHT